MSDIRESGEDYLEAIIQLEDKDGKVRSVDVANRLGVSRPSVNKAVAVLKKEGMVAQELYGDISLTEKGRKRAQLVLGRHFAIKRFLIEILHVDAETADADACRMEHIISEVTFEGIKRLLKERSASLD
ncbi:MAG: metal-dependent transcriptional regulator [Oscillospiraceae bacterium]|jgi:Mn-dependent DtxR family transcriptional regulator|nr:metal-dependent transcriptional regulator [Oscillospiraceae bacterium]